MHRDETEKKYILTAVSAPKKTKRYLEAHNANQRTGSHNLTQKQFPKPFEKHGSHPRTGGARANLRESRPKAIFSRRFPQEKLARPVFSPTSFIFGDDLNTDKAPNV